MAQYTLTGAHIKLYINNKLYNTVQSINFSLDRGESEIWGIDSMYPQEIAPGKSMVRGQISGIRVKHSGGLQAINAMSLFQDAAASPYISIRIQDRQSGEDIMFVPAVKITKESHAVAIKGTYKLSFEFVGMVPLMALDRS